jgi:2-methylaconitate cis-trans-isomerase PrpF
MVDDVTRIPCVIMRGGQSRAVFFHKKVLPSDAELRDRCILRIFGNPNSAQLASFYCTNRIGDFLDDTQCLRFYVNQVDGLGGGNPLTSKVAIVNPSDRKEADVDFLFGEVSIDRPLIYWRRNCLNITSAVAVFAVEESLVSYSEPITAVRIFDVNTSKLITALVPTRNGKVLSHGIYENPGVPWPGARIALELNEYFDTSYQKLLPTGKPQDELKIDRKRIPVSLLNAGKLHVFIPPQKLGLRGTELPGNVVCNEKVLRLIDEIRAVAAERAGLIENREDMAILGFGDPIPVLVSSACDHAIGNNKKVKRNDIDMVARIILNRKIHPGFMISTSICTTVASRVQGTVVQELIGERYLRSGVNRIGHPCGIVDTEIVLDNSRTEQTVVKNVVVGRTARRIMDGFVYVPEY